MSSLATKTDNQVVHAQVRFILHGVGTVRYYLALGMLDYAGQTRQSCSYPSTLGEFDRVTKEVIDSVTRIRVLFKWGVLEHVVSPDGRMSEHLQLFPARKEGKLGIIWTDR